MNPIFSLILKQLPRLLPVVESLVMKRTAAAQPDAGRLSAVEQSLQLLAERSDQLEMTVKRLRLLAIVTLMLSLAAIIIVLVRS